MAERFIRYQAPRIEQIRNIWWSELYKATGEPRIDCVDQSQTMVFADGSAVTWTWKSDGRETQHVRPSTPAPEAA